MCEEKPTIKHRKTNWEKKIVSTEDGKGEENV